MRRRVEEICATLGKAWLQITMDKIDITSHRSPRYSDAPVRSVTANYREREPLPPSMPPTPAQIWPMDPRRLEDESKDEGALLQDWKEDS